MWADPRIAALIPHAGDMVLLERILDCDAHSIRATTTTHRRADHPLAVRGRLRAVHLCEYGAQAMAVHGGLRSAERGQPSLPGVLVSLRDVELHVADIHDLPGELIVTARCLQESREAWQYEFHVTHAGCTLARGRATISVRRD
jgi:predicted hotdog family 3-hydroxylacyl-ACP dehydratase